MKEIKPIYTDFNEMSDPVEILEYTRGLLAPVILKEVNEKGLKTDTVMRLMSADNAMFEAILRLNRLKEN